MLYCVDLCTDGDLCILFGPILSYFKTLKTKNHVKTKFLKNFLRKVVYEHHSIGVFKCQYFNYFARRVAHVQK